MDCRFYNIVLHCHISKSLAFVFIYLLHHHRLDKNRKINKYGFKLSRCNIHRFIGLRKPPGARSCFLRWYIPMPHDNLQFILKAHVRPIDFARLCFLFVPFLSARFWLDVTFTGLFGHSIVSRWHLGCFHPQVEKGRFYDFPSVRKSAQRALLLRWTWAFKVKVIFFWWCPVIMYLR